MSINNYSIPSVPNTVPTVPTGGTTGQYLVKTSGTDYDLNWVSATAIGTTVYIATTGSDTTGDGSSGTPYRTISKAISVLPDILKQEYIISVADGTYAEPIQISDKMCVGSGRITVQGNTTTPNNVTFTGANGGVTVRGGSMSSLALIMGAVNVKLSGIRVNGTASVGILALNNAFLIIDRCNTAGTLTSGVVVFNQCQMEFWGNCTLDGWSSFGFSLQFSSQGSVGTTGTLTITGPASPSGTVWGFHVAAASSFSFFGGFAYNITITNVVKGFSVGLVSNFAFQAGATSTITVDDVTTPTASSGVLVTDCSSWSTTEAVVIDHVTNAYENNSVSYIESAGSRTITNVSQTSVASQNSVIYLP